ncbi:hypothetical protein IHE44_0004792 [Lamprotornis superbus]|uniref:dUTPase-like domain-containing protein n=1 Tax=Lamprotornis superbus TaxID=245042 RepID=A0A835NEJ1_9PASS|nr:hypothetical protein IHE44_0004792 [Lamprotornis superbus]
MGRESLSAFVAGRSSSTMKGINVHLGIIDSDWLGQIYAMVSINEYERNRKGTCIAQLIPFVSCIPIVVDWSHGTGGSGICGTTSEELPEQELSDSVESAVLDLPWPIPVLGFTDQELLCHRSWVAALALFALVTSSPEPAPSAWCCHGESRA